MEEGSLDDVLIIEIKLNVQTIRPWAFVLCNGFDNIENFSIGHRFNQKVTVLLRDGIVIVRQGHKEIIIGSFIPRAPKVTEKYDKTVFNTSLITETVSKSIFDFKDLIPMAMDSYRIMKELGIRITLIKP